MTGKTAGVRKLIAWSGLIVAVAAIVLAYQQTSQPGMQAEPAALVLLLPDDADSNDPQVTVWLDAAREQGFLLTPMRDSDFLHPWLERGRIGGVIVPDQVHKAASDVLVDTLTQYVAQGGRLMLVYDAGVWTDIDRYSQRHSRFSALAGIDYADYSQLQDQVSAWSPILGSAATLAALQIPPGKFALYDDLRGYADMPPVDTVLIDAPLHTLAGYDQPVVSYDNFVTAGSYRGEVLLQTPQGNVAAGLRQHGAGRVLFVNLALGYLKGRTDGMLLYGFLHLFAGRIAPVPYLAAVPNAVGGLVMNWHLDSDVTLSPLEQLRELGLYAQGPYSVHITAGPDAVEKGDGKGLDVNHDEEIRVWMEFFEELGYAVGSHGGWNHDYWAAEVGAEPTPELESFLVLNKQALESVLTQSVVEYSAPGGMHPPWVTDWLAANGFTAYYSTGDSGMPPTRSYRDGRLRHARLWLFPIVTYRDLAGFEEIRRSGPNGAMVDEWLRAMSAFCADNRTARLIYFHPRGALLFPDAVRNWLALTSELADSGQFKWYTMAELSRFLTRRLQTAWGVSQSGAIHTFRARNAQTLAGHTWMLDKTQYGEPKIVEGAARVEADDSHWLVHAEDGVTLLFNAELSTTS